MTLSSSSAQTREIGELRNQLKWMDEERRKSGRKLTELEQRMAQQGRDLAERDRKIQELEWHITNVAERLERVPEEDPKAAAQEQRLQDLEWHLSNLSAQVARQPNPDEERARLAEEVGRSVVDVQQRLQSEQTAVESRLLSQLTELREADEHLVFQLQAMQESLPSQVGLQERLEPVVGRQEAQAQALARVDEQFDALQESVNALSIQLRERTGTLAAEAQSNYAALANRVQEYLDAQAEQFETRTAVIETAWQQRLDAVANRPPETSPEIVLLSAQYEQLEHNLAGVDERVSALVAGSQSDLEARFAPIQSRIADVEQKAAGSESLASRLDQIEESIARLDAVANRPPETSPEIVLLSAQYEQLEHNLAGVDERVSALVAGSQSDLEARFAPIQSRIADVEQKAAGSESLASRLDQIEESVVRLDGAATQADTSHTQLAQSVTQLQGAYAQLEESVTKLGNTRELMALFDRVEQELELRQAEDVRLATLISTQEGRFTPVLTSLEESREGSVKLLARMSDVERVVEETRRSAQDFNDNWKPILTEVSRRVGPLTERVTVLNNSILKAEASLQALNGDQSEMRETLTTLTEETQRSRVETSRQVDAWQATLDEHKDTIERFTQQWLTLSNQYKEARMAVQNFAHWQKQLEQQKREASEMLRIESNRMQSRWDGFLLEIQEKLKNFELELSQKWQAFELENEQRWTGARRSEQVWREELGAVDELIQKLQQDNRNLIWRVQAAQADAIKKWPRLLMEEVEKAVELNPNRRLSSAGATPRPDLSVVDAIEQGLITIDYDDSATDL